MSLFTTIFRPAARPAIPSDSATLLPWHAFDAAIERSLMMLRGVHIPVSLFAVRLGADGLGEDAEVIGDALSQFGSVGRLADGSIALLYLGPRKAEPDGDLALAWHIRTRIERRLQERGWPLLAGQLELAAVHGWTDEIAGSADLMRSLAQRRAYRRAARDATEARRYR
jgi:hypothetical protein